MPDLFATAGASNANSFSTLDEFDAYLDTRLNTAALLTGKSEDDRIRALLESTRDLTLLPYIGTRVTLTQLLAWPRRFAINPDLPNLSTVTDLQSLYFGETVIPERIKRAEWEYAIAFLRAGTTDITLPDASDNVIEKTVGPLTTRYSEPNSRLYGLARWAPRAIQQLAPLLDLSAMGGLQLVRQ